MKLTFYYVCILFCLNLSTICSKATSKRKPKKSHRSSPLISIGAFVSIKYYPYVVGLVTVYEGYSEQFCGGTIIAKNMVLTAAHCLDPKEIISAIEIGKVVVRGGATNIRGSTGYDHRIYGYKVHEQYNSSNPKFAINDIALIQVKDDLNNTFEEPIGYASSDYKYPEGTAAVLGWGRTELNGTNSVKLRGGDVQVVSNCSDYIWADDPGWVCAKPTISRKGDDGGPMVQNNLVIGIIVYNKICSFDCTTVFTRVGYFSQWIETSMTNITSID